jgi:hypothetical protein
MKLLLKFCLLTAATAIAADNNAKMAQILYFKAKPGQFEAYNRYIREIADPIDEEARKAGAFVSLTTLVNPDPAAPWSHLRLFTFASREQLEAFSRKMDEAGVRVFPDEAKRKANGARSALLRDRVGDPVLAEILHD